MKKQMTVLVLSCLLAGTALAGNTAMATSPAMAGDSTNVEMYQSQAEGVNWEDGDIVATGIGLPPEGSGPQGMYLARRAAVVDAQRNLAELINGVSLDADTTMRDLTIASDVVHTKTQAFIKGARIIDQRQNADGSYQVTLRLPLYGSKSVAAIAVPELRGSADSTPQPTVNLAKTALTKPEINEIAQGKYTGIVVNASGLGLDPTFAPVIYDEDGRVIYGLDNLDYDFAINHGMVSYATSEADAVRPGNRGGSNPLVVKAKAVRGGKNSTNPVNVVVSREDGDRILLACQESNIVKRAAVVFIR